MKERITNGPRIEFLLVEENPAEIASVQNAFKKANIRNRLHVLREATQIFDFLFRTGAYDGQPALPREMLILLALKFRGMHGLDVLRKIKNDERTKPLPVIILTGSQEERGVMQSYKLGANACIVKPVELSKLIEAIADLRLGWVLVTAEDTIEN